MTYKWTIATHVYPIHTQFPTTHVFKPIHTPAVTQPLVTYTTCAHLRKQAAYYIHTIFGFQPSHFEVMAKTFFFFCNYCFVQCNLSFHWKLLPNVTFTASLVLHTNSNSSTNHMNKSSHILVSAMVQGKRKFFFILETTLNFILYITIFILWIVNKSHAQKNSVIFSHFLKKHFVFLLLQIFKIFLALKKKHHHSPNGTVTALHTQRIAAFITATSNGILHFLMQNSGLYIKVTNYFWCSEMTLAQNRDFKADRKKGEGGTRTNKEMCDETTCMT